MVPLIGLSQNVVFEVMYGMIFLLRACRVTVVIL